VIAALVALYVLWVFVGLMVLRLIIDYLMLFVRSFRPTGLLAAAFEVAYTVTDPPLRALRRFLPPLRLGRYSLDVSFLVVFVAAYALIDVVRPYAS
jgi:YggT family protein